jgi:hypothetical protein
MNPNPLSQYFRLPALHVSLPSQGKFYSKDALDRTEDNQYPVLALSRQDEIVYVSAPSDGSSIASIIASCVPNIKDVKKMPIIDVDKLLVAVRIASQGSVLQDTAVCTNCKTENPVTVDLNQTLKQFESPDYSQPLAINDLQVYFRPILYQQANVNTANVLDDQAVADAIDDTVEPEVRTKQIERLLEKIRSMSTAVLSQHILYIQTPSARVDNSAHIVEWLNNCEKSVYLQLQQHIVSIKQQTELQPVAVTCSACSTEFKHNYRLNLAGAV